MELEAGSLKGPGDPRPVFSMECPWPHQLFDGLTEALLYFMIVFSPWAFGATQEWSMNVMDACGYALGALLAAKWSLRLMTDWQPLRWGMALADEDDPRPSRSAGTFTKILAALTVLVLAYCVVSAVNARAVWLPHAYRFEYYPCIDWLPHSYDLTRTWQAFWHYLACAMSFWALRDWLLTRTEEEESANRDDALKSARRRGLILPPRLQRLLWVLCLNGAVLALEGVLQRTSGTSKLLWLVEPGINKTADAQFGPYAYRSNAAQYFTLVWPVALGFWWVRHQAAQHERRARATYHLLLPCTMLMAACPLISLSRAGAVVGVAGLVIALLTLAFLPRESGWKVKLGVLAFLAVIAALGWYIGWEELAKRFQKTGMDFEVGRGEMWKLALQMIRDYPVLGTGPGTFESLYQMYRGSVDNYWPAQLHNDWLEMMITFGAVGLAMIAAALLAVLVRCYYRGGIRVHRVFAMFVWLAVGGCLAFGAVDFPFQIYSIVFLFIVHCAILSSVSRA